MASSEIVDSGRFAGQKSHFSQTCNLLSQYLKEKKGNFGDLSLGIHRDFDSSGSPTMDLFPMIEKSGESAAATNPKKSMNLFSQQAAAMKTESEPEKAQMTIFYGGQVIVFDDFPADKVKEIMLMASISKVINNPNNTFPACAILPAPKPEESAPDFVIPMAIQEHKMPSQPIVSDLPIARRASLTRFLEKRKDRLTGKAPYQMNPPKKQAAHLPKMEENKAWLGLGAQFPVMKTEQY